LVALDNEDFDGQRKIMTKVLPGDDDLGLRLAQDSDSIIQRMLIAHYLLEPVTRARLERGNWVRPLALSGFAGFGETLSRVWGRLIGESGAEYQASLWDLIQSMVP